MIVIGTFGDNQPANDAGSLHVYRYDDKDWNLEQNLIASDFDANDQFGISVAVSGDVIVAGASSDSDDGNHSGSAYVFRFDGGTWAEFYSPDGKIEGHYQGKKYQARWSVRGPVICFFDYKEAWNDVCRTLSLNEGKVFYHHLKDGSSVGSALVTSGNALANIVDIPALARSVSSRLQAHGLVA